MSEGGRGKRVLAGRRIVDESKCHSAHSATLPSMWPIPWGAGEHGQRRCARAWKKIRKDILIIFLNATLTPLLFPLHTRARFTLTVSNPRSRRSQLRAHARPALACSARCPALSRSPVVAALRTGQAATGRSRSHRAHSSCILRVSTAQRSGASAVLILLSLAPSVSVAISFS